MKIDFLSIPSNDCWKLKSSTFDTIHILAFRVSRCWNIMTWDFVYQIRRFELVKSIIITILQRWQMILHMKFKGTNWTFLFPKIKKKIFCGKLSRRSLPWLESILSSEQFLFPNKYQSQIQISKQRLHGLLLMALMIVRDRQWKVWFPVLICSRSSKKIVTINGQKNDQKFEACCHSECCSGTPSELCCKAKWPVFDIS